MYAWSAPTIEEENQMMAAHLGPSVTTEPASPASRKPGLHRPTTKPSHQFIVFRSRRSSTATSAMSSPSDSFARRARVYAPRWRRASLGGRIPAHEGADPGALRVRPYDERGCR